MVLMRDLSFEVESGDVFAILGGSGTGKSTLMCTRAWHEGVQKPPLPRWEWRCTAPPASLRTTCAEDDPATGEALGRAARRAAL